LEENRERFAEDIRFSFAADEVEIVDLDDEQADDEDSDFGGN
jgi:hypothetical protein